MRDLCRAMLSASVSFLLIRWLTTHLLLYARPFQTELLLIVDSLNLNSSKMARIFALTVTLLMLTKGGQAFSVRDIESRRTGLVLQSQGDDSISYESARRDFLTSVASTTTALTLGSVTSGVLLPPPLAAHAVSGLDKVSAKLKAYGLPPLSKVPGGYAPLLEIYGKGKNRFPILLTFLYPITWVVTVPSIDANGEDGTVQAGEYAKGDTATFYVYEGPGHVNDVASQPKELFEKALIKCISQKGDNMYQNFKVLKLEPKKVDNQTYMMADFKYQLLTGAGFEVDRRGVASITSEGPAVEVLWAASTSVRYKKTEDTLREIVNSFRCYADGLNLSDELVDTGF